MREFYGNKGDVHLIIDGKDYYPKEVTLTSSDGASFKWKQRHWNTGTEGMAGAFDVVHRLPEGLNKPKEPDPLRRECSYCGRVYDPDFLSHYSTRYKNSGGYCETFMRDSKGWALTDRRDWR